MSREYPECPLVGVGAIVLEGRRILLVKRGKEPCAGKWSIPGGLVELGEKLEEAVKRELFEETGIRGEPRGVLCIVEYLERDREDRVRYHYVLVDYLVEPLDPLESAEARGDVEEVGVFELREALEDLDLAEGTRRILSMLAREIK
mgnify:CR=1 FL=1